MHCLVFVRKVHLVGAAPPSFPSNPSWKWMAPSPNNIQRETYLAGSWIGEFETYPFDEKSIRQVVSLHF